MTWLSIWLIANALFVVWRVWKTSAGTKAGDRIDHGRWVASNLAEVEPPPASVPLETRQVSLWYGHTSSKTHQRPC
jgi:hypothetical protein